MEEADEMDMEKEADVEEEVEDVEEEADEAKGTIIVTL